MNQAGEEHTDRIFIEEQTIHCSIGLTAEERSSPQRIVLTTSAGLGTSLAEVGTSVDLSRGICYEQLATRFKELACSRSWTLVEELGEALAELAFREFSSLEVIELRIKKFVVPETSSVGIHIKRFRPASPST